MTASRRRLPLLVLLCSAAALTACTAQRPKVRVEPPANRSGAAIVRTAQAFVGTPYRMGGADPRGFDCSGFVYYVFAQHDIVVPRNVSRQWKIGREVSRQSVRAGDLLFFATSGRSVTHVTIALDRGRFIHAPSSRGVVRVESLSSSYWAPRFVGARRVAP
jgi:cell wall-associated NlpC family hydrolase